MNFGVFITCRNGSSRLHGKCNLKLINETSYIEYIFKRSKKIKTKCQKILCTTKNNADLDLIKKAKKFQIKSYRGDTLDKLERWRKAAKKFKIDFFVTIDGDDPLFDPSLVDKAFKQSLKNKPDFIEGKGLICGLFTYGIKTKALNKVCKIKKTNRTEMMSVYFTNTGLFKCEQLEKIKKIYYRRDIRLTLDYKEDHIFFKTLMKKTSDKFLGTLKIINIVKKYPEILKINKTKIKQWENNQIKNTKLILK